MFLILFVLSFLILTGKVAFYKGLKSNLFVSGLGTLYATYFAYPEVKDLVAGTFENRFLGLSTCVYGLLFFVLIFLLTIWTLRKQKAR